ncbi:MAG TPA: carbamoyltransferase C-terminal domain-containing protein [bacterium]|nr:carbamoyltransferase C-terminal domain-containing protein [bacterium]
MPNYVLGLDINDYNTSAALVGDDRLLAAVQEERLNREKRTRRFPVQAMNYCLRQAGIGLRDLAAVAVSVNPAIYLEALNPLQSERARWRGELLYAPLNYLLGQTPGADAQALQVHLRDAQLGDVRVHYVAHHDSHAATAYYLSPFADAAVLSIDAFGEKETTVFYRANGAAIERLRHVEFPHSVGSFYAALTEFLGLVPDRHEWKLMAAAAHGDPDVYYAPLKSLIFRTAPAAFEVNLPYFNYYQFHRPGRFTRRLCELLGEPYAADAAPDRRFFDIAAATQKVTEDLVFALLNDLAEIVPSENLCLCGGVAMNCVLNGKIPAHTPFKKVFVPPMPDDSGSCIGAAWRVAIGELGRPRPAPMVHNYLGPAFSDEQIEAELRRDKIRFARPDDIAPTAAQKIADGRLVGWFQGGVEFGDRALGNRSILADPRDPASPIRINETIKNRRPYQPFAPSVLAERADDFFQTTMPSPFMEKTFYVRPARAGKIPAVLGPDGSARVQTVTGEQNALYHRLIAAFADMTGVPLVLNTSFNLRGEAIVCTPRDALRTFYSSGLDVLCLGPFLIEK